MQFTLIVSTQTRGKVLNHILQPSKPPNHILMFKMFNDNVGVSTSRPIFLLDSNKTEKKKKNKQ